MKREVILNLLYNLGGRREAERYLREYTQADADRLAVVKVGGALIANDLENLSSSLAFLRHVGMAPVVIHGAGPQLSQELERQGIQSEWRDGLRVTSPAILQVAHQMFLREGSRLAETIDEHEVRARLIPTGVFEVVPDDPEKLGLVGRVTRVNLDPVRSALESGYVPILSPLGVTQEGQLLNLNADTAAAALVQALQPHKILFLTETGGILDAGGQIIQAVNLEEDLQRMLDHQVVTGGMARKLIEISETLQALPAHSSISITTPEHVARELFTHRGSGTLVRRGAAIQVFPGLSRLDRSELKKLLERSFGRQLREGYFEKVAGAEALIDPYTAVAIVLRESGFDYLDKFAVTAEAQGSGIGASLWNRLVERHPRLVWRSRVDNTINGWYMQNADGMCRAEKWLVFWRGLSRLEAESAINYSLAQEPSFGAPVEVVE